MIRNVYGEEVTNDTAMAILEMDDDNMCDFIDIKERAMVALALKDRQGKEDEEAMKYVEKLRDQWAKDESTCAFTLGWIYNASGSTIGLVSCRHWGGSLVSNPYPLRIKNGQWGMFIQKQDRSDLHGCSGALVYRSLLKHNINFYWCIAWRSQKYEGRPNQTNVHVKIVREVDWDETNTWKSIGKAIQKTCSLHKANLEEWYSVISASYGPQALFEAVVSLQDL